jgi:hypothetical protein
MVPTFTSESIGEAGARLYPDSIATATPQAFTVAFPPDHPTGFEVARQVNKTPTATRCIPAHIRQI